MAQYLSAYTPGALDGAWQTASALTRRAVLGFHAARSIVDRRRAHLRQAGSHAGGAGGPVRTGARLDRPPQADPELRLLLLRGRELAAVYPAVPVRLRWEYRRGGQTAVARMSEAKSGDYLYGSRHPDCAAAPSGLRLPRMRYQEGWAQRMPRRFYPFGSLLVPSS